MIEIIKKNRHITTGFLAAGALAGLFLFASPNQEPFRPIEEFVLFGKEGVHIAEGTQSLSGGIGTNGKLFVAENVRITGDIFGKEIRLAEGAEIDGNVFAKKLHRAEDVQILGETSTDITFLVAEIPAIPPFTPGTEDIVITEKDQTLAAGSFRDLIIKSEADVTLSGTYNLRSLRVEENGTIFFGGPTTVNVQNHIRIAENTILTPKPATLSVKEIRINYIGKKPVTIGEESWLGLILVVPSAKVHIGEETTLRGGTWGREISVGERGNTTNSDAFATSVDPSKVVRDPEGGKIMVNEILVDLIADAPPRIIQIILDTVGGRVSGFTAVLNEYAIEVETESIEELNERIATIAALGLSEVESVTKSPLMVIPFD